MSERGDLQVSVGANKTGYSQELSRARAEARAFAQDVSQRASNAFTGLRKSAVAAAAGFISVGAIWGGIRRVVSGVYEDLDKITDMSDQFGVASGEFQKWDQSLKEAGLSAKVLASALDSIRAKRAAARDKGDFSDFASLGLSDAAAGGMSDYDLLMSVLRSGAPRSRINRLTGRAGGKLVGVLDDYSKSEEIYSPSQQEAFKLAKGETARLKNAAKRVGVSFLDPRWAGAESMEDINSIIEQNRRQNLEARKQQATESAEEAMAAEGEINQARLEAEVEGEQKNQEKLRQAREKLDEAILQSLPDEERNAVIARKMDDLGQRLKQYEPVYDALGTEDKVKVAGMLAEMFGLEKSFKESKALKEKKGGAFEMDYNPTELARVGLFTNATIGGGSIDIQRQMLRHLANIDLKTGRDAHD